MLCHRRIQSSTEPPQLPTIDQHRQWAAGLSELVSEKSLGTLEGAATLQDFSEGG